MWDDSVEWQDPGVRAEQMALGVNFVGMEKGLFTKVEMFCRTAVQMEVSSSTLAHHLPERECFTKLGLSYMVLDVVCIKLIRFQCPAADKFDIESDG